MTLDEFNQTQADSLRPLLLACAAIPRWADGIIAARPFPGPEQLLAFAGHLAQMWGPEQVEQALSQHPRLGETRQAQDAGAAHSRREQSRLSLGDRRLKTALQAGNREYEARFNRIFLIRAAGRSGEEILACLRRRLQNSAEQEQLETANQLREIALLRLRRELSL